jgi:DNA-nicking Smr family endonuclease
MKAGIKMKEAVSGFTVTVDIHGMKEEEARHQLELLLGRVPPHIREVVVIHGFRGGTVLRDMVRKKLKHPRIRRTFVTLNDGQTTIELKENQTK